MEVNILSQVGNCEEFMETKASNPISVSIVVSPLKIIGGETENDAKIISGCNMWHSCQNSRCHFSAAGRKLPKVNQL